MALNDNSATTMGQTVTVQNRTMVGTFGTRICDRAFMITISTDDDGFDPSVADAWFTQETLQDLYISAEKAGPDGIVNAVVNGIKVKAKVDEQLG
jgi:hypothetical protein